MIKFQQNVSKLCFLWCISYWFELVCQLHTRKRLSKLLHTVAFCSRNTEHKIGVWCDWRKCTTVILPVMLFGNRLSILQEQRTQHTFNCERHAKRLLSKLLHTVAFGRGNFVVWTQNRCRMWRKNMCLGPQIMGPCSGVSFCVCGVTKSVGCCIAC